jgi:mono/diheme cytochrome c family protein
VISSRQHHVVNYDRRRPQASNAARWRVATLLAALCLIIVAPARADVFAGEEIYRQHCELCHGPGGNPVLPDAPNFVRGDGLMQPDRMLAQAIRDGKNAMPGYYGILTDQEVIDVVTYLRTLF